MNVIDCKITRILSQPYFHDFGSGIGRWWVDVETIDEGCISHHSVMFDSLEEAEKLAVGDVIQR